MPRIRTIKPAFWSSPDTARASLVARLTYIAMWNWADDYGRGTLNFKELEGFVFPNDDVMELTKEVPPHSVGSSAAVPRNFRAVVGEVCEVFNVTTYEVDRRLYFEIPAWREHQRVERRASMKHPCVEQAEYIVVIDREGNIDRIDQAINESDLGNQGNSLHKQGNIRQKLSTDAELPVWEIGNRNKEIGNRKREIGSGDAEIPTHSPTATHTPLDAEPPSAPYNPFDWSTPQDPRCPAHAGLPRADVPPCHQCARARAWFEQHAVEHAQQLAHQHRTQIAQCPQCDEHGWINTTIDGKPAVTRCTHEQPPTLT